MTRGNRLTILAVLDVWLAIFTTAFAGLPCRIEVRDAENDWPVPLVELRTTSDMRFITDNAGVIAFDLPELMGRETWFAVSSPNYELPADGFGFRGVRLTPTAGGHLKVEVRRTLPARRIGRLTGSGLFAESQKLGDEQDWKESGLVGCDSVQTALHRGRRYWLWGDTTLARYPLGIFSSLGATTPPSTDVAPAPPLKPSFDYFRNESFEVIGVAPLPGDGPTWLHGLVSLTDAQGSPHLVASYMKIKPPLEEYERGVCEWNEGQQRFQKLDAIWTQTEGPADPPPMPHGHAVRWTDQSGREWVLFGDPFPTIRCSAKFESWRDRTQWELLPNPAREARTMDGTGVLAHRGSIAWNEHRRCWVTVFTQLGGRPSHLGEIWYAESATPFGPWVNATKVLSHENYTFYNPLIHPEWTADDPSQLYFEGTYTKTFSSNQEPTPRYEYNQILYRLDLSEPPFRNTTAPTPPRP